MLSEESKQKPLRIIHNFVVRSCLQATRNVLAELLKKSDREFSQESIIGIVLVNTNFGEAVEDQED
jgi:hypothetical protein